MKRLLLCLVIALFVSVVAPAQATSTLAWGPWGENEDTQQPVEQQTLGGDTQPDHSLWVVNNTVGNNNPQDDAGLRCAWDADDSRSMGLVAGPLPPGGSALGTKCWIADEDEHFTYVGVFSKSPNLVVTMRYDPQGFVLTASARWDAASRVYNYEVCGFGPGYDSAYTGWQAIPNSGTAPNTNHPEFIGGVGVPSTFTVSVSNPTDRTVRDVYGVARLHVTNVQVSGGRCPEFSVAWNSLGAYPGPSMWWTVP